MAPHTPLLALLIAGLLGGSARAAEPWLVLDAPGVRVHHHEAHAKLARSVAAAAVEERPRLAAELGPAATAGVIDLYLAAGRRELHRLAPGPAPPDWAAGVAWPARGLVVLPLAGVRRQGIEDLFATLRHELAHVALYRAAAGRTPRWFDEGYAVYRAGQWSFERFRVLGWAALTDRLIPLAKLDQGFPAGSTEASLAYAQSISFVSWIAAEYGPGTLRALLSGLAAGQGFSSALEQATGRPLAELERAWAADLELTHSWIPLVSSGTFLWFLVSLLAILAWRASKRRRGRRLDEMAFDEAVEDARLAAVQGRITWIEPATPLSGEEPDGSSRPWLQ